MHRAGYVHTDVNNDNLLIGNRTADGDSVHLIGYGSCVEYRDKTGAHVSRRKEKVQPDSVYASRNMHQGFIRSRKNDLESAIYSLLFLGLGKMDWEGMTPEAVFKCKNMIPAEALCYGFPKSFVELYKMIRDLQYEQEPEYERYRTLLKGALVETEGRESIFD